MDLDRSGSKPWNAAVPNVRYLCRQAGIHLRNLEWVGSYQSPDGGFAHTPHPLPDRNLLVWTDGVVTGECKV